MAFPYQSRRGISMKLLMIPNDTNLSRYENTNIDGYIVGWKGYSIFNNCLFTLDELKHTISKIVKQGKEVFLSINKLMYNEDIEELRKHLFEIDQLGLTGILFDDLSLLHLKNEMKLKTDLVYGSSHLLTSYQTANYYYNFGVSYGVVSTEITLEHILNLKKNTKMKLMTTIYGYLGMTHSSRNLIHNYFEYIGEEKKDSTYYMYEKVRNEDYPVYEDENGTYILSSHIMNGARVIPELIENNMDYVIMNGLNIEHHVLDEVIEKIGKIREDYHNIELVLKLHDEISNLTPKTDYGFLYKETIYRVKNNDK